MLKYTTLPGCYGCSADACVFVALVYKSKAHLSWRRDILYGRTCVVNPIFNVILYPKYIYLGCWYTHHNDTHVWNWQNAFNSIVRLVYTLAGSCWIDGGGRCVILNGAHIATTHRFVLPSLVRVCRARNDRLCNTFTCDNYVLQIKMKNKGGLFIECDTRYFWNFKRASRRYVGSEAQAQRHTTRIFTYYYYYRRRFICEGTGKERRSVSRVCLACAILRVILNVRVCVIQSHAFL